MRDFVDNGLPPIEGECSVVSISEEYRPLPGVPLAVAAAQIDWQLTGEELIWNGCKFVLDEKGMAAAAMRKTAASAKRY